MKNVGTAALITTFLVGGITAVANTHYALETANLPIAEIASGVVGGVVGGVSGWLARGRKVAKAA
jgi:ABC-type xylose transport system permease subunit